MSLVSCGTLKHMNPRLVRPKAGPQQRHPVATRALPLARCTCTYCKLVSSLTAHVDTPLTPTDLWPFPSTPSNARLQHSETQVSTTFLTNTQEQSNMTLLRPSEPRQGRAHPGTQSAFSWPLFQPSTCTARTWSLLLKGQVSSPHAPHFLLPLLRPLQPTPHPWPLSAPPVGCSRCQHPITPSGRPCRKVSWSEVPFSRLFSSGRL